MTTLQLSMELDTGGESTCLAVDSHVRILVAPIRGRQGWMVPDRGSSLKCLGLLNKRDPLLSLLKTCVTSSIWGSTFVCLAWRPLVTRQRRLLFLLQVSARGTEETESLSLVPTLTAWECNRCAGRPGQSSNYTTTDSGTVGWRNKQGSTSFVGLAPTLLAHDQNGRNQTRAERKGANSHRGNATSFFRASESDPVFLNPSFAEIFMGFPEGWTLTETG